MDEKKLLPKLERGNVVMITINPRHQFTHNSISNRINKSNVIIRELYEILKTFLKEVQINKEISEVLCSEGDKTYPRIHYHALGILKDPIECYLQCGYITDKYGGYHIMPIETQEQHEYYVKYINKQSQLWKATKHILYKLGSHIVGEN